MEPKFEEYTLDELRDVEEQIDQEKFPERYQRICELISLKSGPEIKEQESDDTLRDLYKEYKSQKFRFWRIFRGALVMFISFRVMEYFDWTLNQKIIGAVVVLVAYVFLLIFINEIQFNKFKRKFEKRT